MIPKSRGTEVESTLTGEDVRVGIAKGAEAHIMGVLTDLYEDAEMAMVREYATNARDAHIEAGNDAPIEVTTPTSLQPTLTIRDYGVGLDADAIRRIYSQYGASTKRGTDDATGMLGLGCKSALTYTDQFSVIGVKGGRRIAVSVHRDEDGTASMTLLADDPTDEPNGVTVSIPVRRDNELAAKAAMLFRYWPKGSVLLDGQMPERCGDGEGYWLTDRLLLEETAGGGRYGPDRHRLETDDLIVMGGVPYPTTDLNIEAVTKSSRRRAGYGGRRLIAFVDIGSVQFTPSREGLMESVVTERGLDAIRSEFRVAADKAIRDRVAQADSAEAAALAYAEARDWLPGFAPATCDWQGRTLPGVFTDPTIDQADGEFIWSLPAPGQNASYRQGGESAYSSAFEIECERAVTGIWITGWTNTTFSTDQRRKLDAFLAADRGDLSGISGIFLTPKDQPPHADWIDPGRVYAWDTVKKWRDPSKPTAPKHRAPTGSYWTHSTERSYGGKIAADDLPTSGLFYRVGRQYGHGRVWERLQAALGDEAKAMVVVPQPRAAKFRRTFPQAREAEDALRAKAVEWWDSVPDATKESIAWRRDAERNELNVIDLLRRMDPAKLDDPDLEPLIAAAKRDVEKPHQRFRTMAALLPSPSTNGLNRKLIRERYPLLDSIANARYAGSRVTSDLYLYANAAYAAKKGGSA